MHEYVVFDRSHSTVDDKFQLATSTSGARLFHRNLSESLIQPFCGNIDKKSCALSWAVRYPRVSGLREGAEFVRQGVLRVRWDKTHHSVK